jgi:hypothetical protein
VLGLIILPAVVGSRCVMLPAKLEFTVLTFERQKIDKTAIFSRALVSDRKEHFGISRHDCFVQDGRRPGAL